jgi:hypothetical protein
MSKHPLPDKCALSTEGSGRASAFNVEALETILKLSVLMVIGVDGNIRLIARSKESYSLSRIGRYDAK